MKKTTTKKTVLEQESKRIQDKLPKRSIRFEADPMTLGYIDLEGSKEFDPHLVGIVVNESYAGCSLVLVSDIELKLKQKINIKVGALDPIRANIAWLKHLEENIYKVGIKYLE